MENLIGKRFGNLVVEENVDDYRVKCLCDCGNYKIAYKVKLEQGHVKSCGCGKYKRNKYDLTGEYGVGYYNNNNGFFIFDKEDYDKIKDYTWQPTTNGYCRSSDKKSFHRIVMDCPEGLLVDHINHNKFDNRKANLRICTQQQNSRNKKVSRNNFSGVSGVVYVKNRNRWKARIWVNGVGIYLGHYKTFEEAVKARKEAEQKYFGEFAYKEE